MSIVKLITISFDDTTTWMVEDAPKICIIASFEKSVIRAHKGTLLKAGGATTVVCLLPLYGGKRDVG